MAQKTSWEGEFTKRLRAQGLKGFYTRYINRKSRTGLEVVVPKDKYLEIYTPQGAFKRVEPKKIEPSYHNFSGNESSAQFNYDKFVKKVYNRKLAQLRGKK